MTSGSSSGGRSEPRRTMMRKAFTLVELLVVLAILAVLAALLFPVFASARLAGKNAGCQSNLRQIGMATQAYIKDWDDYYPKALEIMDHFGAYAAVAYDDRDN